MEEWGKKLKKIREDKKLTLSDIEKETNINIRILKYIESGDFEKLPKGIFAKNFIRQYCRFVDVNADDVINDVFQIDNGVHELNMEINSKNNFSIKLIIFLIIAIIVFFTIWFLITKYGKKNLINSNQIHSLMNNSLIKKNIVENKIDKKEDEIAKNISTLPKPIEKELVLNEKEKQEDLSKNDLKVEVIESDISEHPKPTLPGKLQIFATDDCWIHFTCNALNEDFIIKKGETVSFSCNGLINFSIGNSPAIKVTFNGNELNFPIDKKVIKDFTLNLDDFYKQVE